MEEDDTLFRYILNGNPNIPYIYYTFSTSSPTWISENLRQGSRVNSHLIFDDKGRQTGSSDIGCSYVCYHRQSIPWLV